MEPPAMLKFEKKLNTEDLKALKLFPGDIVIIYWSATRTQKIRIIGYNIFTDHVAKFPDYIISWPVYEAEDLTDSIRGKFISNTSYWRNADKVTIMPSSDMTEVLYGN